MVLVYGCLITVRPPKPEDDAMLAAKPRLNPSEIGIVTAGRLGTDGKGCFVVRKMDADHIDQIELALGKVAMG